MTRAVKDYFFANFPYDEVYSYMEEENLPSAKTAEANGMRFLCFFESKDGRCKVYRITRCEWEKQRQNHRK